MAQQYRAYVKYDGPDSKRINLEPLTKAIYEDEYLSGYNFYVDLINPMYEEWNKEYDAKYGAIDTDEDMNRYNEFIREKHRKLIAANPYKNKYIDIDSGEQAELIGKTKKAAVDVGLPDVVMHFYLKQV